VQKGIYNLIIVTGPTAGGKTAFAARLAGKINGEIISADSRQVYRQMNLGTGKDYGDYIVENKIIPVHLIDICDPGTAYNVFDYQKDFYEVFAAVKNRKKVPVVCGGTGMYLEAVTAGYRMTVVPENNILRKELSTLDMSALTEKLLMRRKLHNTTDTTDRNRLIRAIEIAEYEAAHPELIPRLPDIKPLIFGIRYDRETQRKRITERLLLRLKNGMIEEVEELLDSGIPAEKLIYYGLEYKYITLYLKGELSYETMVSKLNTAIHQFAKRQVTWFRRMERKGTIIHWLEGGLSDTEKFKVAIDILQQHTYKV
jgi:tRNA dimethylallyltransferase